MTPAGTTVWTYTHPTNRVARAARYWGAATGAPEEATARLHPPAFPNPFRGSVSVPYTLGRTRSVEILVLDPAGRLVRVLDQGVRPAGTHTGIWDGRDAAGRRAPPGVYLVRLPGVADGTVRKLVLAGGSGSP